MTKNNKKIGGHLLADQLSANGVDIIFCVPGESYLGLMDGLYNHKEKIKLTTFLEFKNNLSKTLEAINLGFGSFVKPLEFLNFNKNNQNLSKKKWVRNDKNDNIKV